MQDYDKKGATNHAVWIRIYTIAVAVLIGIYTTVVAVSIRIYAIAMAVSMKINNIAWKKNAKNADARQKVHHQTCLATPNALLHHFLGDPMGCGAMTGRT